MEKWQRQNHKFCNQDERVTTDQGVSRHIRKPHAEEAKAVMM